MVHIPPAAPLDPIRIDRVAPNPMRASSALHFSLKNQASVELRVFDIHGRCVTAPNIHSLLSPGEHVLKLEGADLPSGIYFIELRAGDDTATRSFMHIR